MDHIVQSASKRAALLSSRIGRIKSTQDFLTPRLSSNTLPILKNPLRRLPAFPSTGCRTLTTTSRTRQHFRPIPQGRLSSRQFHSCPSLLSPSATADSAPAAASPSTPNLTTDRYHQLADSTLESLMQNIEKFSEGFPEIDVDYSSGVMTIVHPEGTFVINKQPANRQIWLSSPVSGPKRYDWVEDEGPLGKGDWVYLRDGHVMRELLEEEIGVSYTIQYD